MDKSIPAGAALLLRFIYETETGRESPECYDVIYGHNQHKLTKPITSMTLDELGGHQPGFTKNFGSSASGAYQIMRNTLDAPGTLADIVGQMGLSDRELFSPDLQDRMGYHLLKRRGYLEFKKGKLSTIEFGKRLAQEWASFPVLTPVLGAHRSLGRGQSYYTGDALNKALVKPEAIEALLAQVLAADDTKPLTVNPATVGLGVLLAGALATIAHWVAGIPCFLFGAWC